MTLGAADIDRLIPNIKEILTLTRVKIMRKKLLKMDTTDSAARLYCRHDSVGYRCS